MNESAMEALAGTLRITPGQHRPHLQRRGERKGPAGEAVNLPLEIGEPQRQLVETLVERDDARRLGRSRRRRERQGARQQRDGEAADKAHRLTRNS